MSERKGKGPCPRSYLLPIGGYACVVRYEQHMPAHTHCGLISVPHQSLKVIGPDAAPSWTYAAKPIASLISERKRYSVTLDESATIIDDIIVFGLDENAFAISTLLVKGMMAWMLPMEASCIKTR